MPHILPTKEMLFLNFELHRQVLSQVSIKLKVTSRFHLLFSQLTIFACLLVFHQITQTAYFSTGANLKKKRLFFCHTIFYLCCMVCIDCYDGRRTTNKLKHQQAFNLGSSKSAHLTTRSGLQRIVSRDVYEAKNNTMIS